MDALAVHKAMLKPDAYPEAPEAIEFRETHVSRIYLTAERVYKVKKPVDFGFLNFTTLDRRRFYCQEEVRLNRRFCPYTYLGVVEIRREGERIAVDGRGETIDYAVVMKRLPQARMLDHLLERDDPSLPAEMERLGRHIAELEEQAPCAPERPLQPNREVVQRNWRENLAQTAPFAGHTLPPRAQAVTADWVKAFLDSHSALLQRREDQGFVRDGHGDLHAEHICLLEPIRIYDCIEFNERYRVADQLADLAFLLMDLEYRDRRDLAEILLGAYLKRGGDDPDLEPLLPFYKLYRAWVRGKVESFLAVEKSAPGPVRAAAASRARRYFNLGLGYLCRPVMILTSGLMGVGKTTVARALAAALGAELLRSDEVRKELAGPRRTEGERGWKEGIYTEGFDRLTYETLRQRALEALQGGRPVIVDASFARRADREAFRSAATQAGVPLALLAMSCERELTLERLDRRQRLGGDASDGRRELYDRQAARFEAPAGKEDTIAVDTSGDVDYNVGLILSKLAASAVARGDKAPPAQGAER